MTVAELITELSKLDPNLKTFTFGSYQWHETEELKVVKFRKSEISGYNVVSPMQKPEDTDIEGVMI